MFLTPTYEFGGRAAVGRLSRLFLKEDGFDSYLAIGERKAALELGSQLREGSSRAQLGIVSAQVKTCQGYIVETAVHESRCFSNVATKSRSPSQAIVLTIFFNTSMHNSKYTSTQMAYRFEWLIDPYSFTSVCLLRLLE